MPQCCTQMVHDWQCMCCSRAPCLRPLHQGCQRGGPRATVQLPHVAQGLPALERSFRMRPCHQSDRGMCQDGLRSGRAGPLHLWHSRSTAAYATRHSTLATLGPGLQGGALHLAAAAVCTSEAAIGRAMICAGGAIWAGGGARATGRPGQGPYQLQPQLRCLPLGESWQRSRGSRGGGRTSAGAQEQLVSQGTAQLLGSCWPRRACVGAAGGGCRLSELPRVWLLGRGLQQLEQGGQQRIHG
jgi:hypothetical protein